MTERLGDLLVREGRLEPAGLERALGAQRLMGGRLGTNLLELGLITESVLLEALGRQHASCTVGRTELAHIAPPVLRCLPEKMARRYRLVPYQVRGKTLFVASTNPGDLLHEDEISFLTSFMVRTCLALEVHVALALRQYYRAPVERRFLALAKRLATGGGVAVDATETTPSLAPASGPAAEPSRTTAAATPAARAQTPTSKAPAAKAHSTDLEFIELDADELASLRRPTSDASDVEAQPEPEAQPELETQLEPKTAEDAPGLDSDPESDLQGDLQGDIQKDFGSEVETGLLELERDHESDAETRLMIAARELQNADIRDEIGDVLLAWSAAYFSRRLLLIARRGRIVGWRGSGEGVREEAVRGIDIDAQAPSVFSGLRDASSFWLGPLPPLPSNRQVLEALGNPPPRDCLVLPVVLRSKVVCHLFADNRERGVAGTPVADMKRLVAKAGLAFEVYILKNKIRML